MRDRLIRAATWVGDRLGRLRNRRVAARQDAYVRAWKAAWAEGCDARRQSVPEDAVPHKPGPARDAWRAGWQWADRDAARREDSNVSR